MLPDRVSNPGPLTYESGALPIALRGPATGESVIPLSGLRPGELKGIKKLRLGDLLVEYTNKAHIECLLSLKQFHHLKVTVSLHGSLNTCKGVVRCPDSQGWLVVLCFAPVFQSISGRLLERGRKRRKRGRKRRKDRVLGLTAL